MKTLTRRSTTAKKKGGKSRPKYRKPTNAAGGSLPSVQQLHLLTRAEAMALPKPKDWTYRVELMHDASNQRLYWEHAPRRGGIVSTTESYPIDGSMAAAADKAWRAAKSLVESLKDHDTIYLTFKPLQSQGGASPAA